MKNLIKHASALVMMAVLGLVAQPVFATSYYMANGGSYWMQIGSEWHTINNDGYCVSGRGPCGSSLWYLQWSYNTANCTSTEAGHWNAAQVLPNNGSIYAWIDGSAGNMTGADYSVTYNYGSNLGMTVDQSPYYEAWDPVITNLYRIEGVTLTDGWGNLNPCNSVTGLIVEFDEIKLVI